MPFVSDILTSLLNANLLFFREISTDIAWRLICDAAVITFARFPACGTKIVGIKKETEVLAFRLFGLCTRLVVRHVYCNKMQVEMWKTHKQ